DHQRLDAVNLWHPGRLLALQDLCLEHLDHRCVGAHDTADVGARYLDIDFGGDVVREVLVVAVDQLHGVRQGPARGAHQLLPHRTLHVGGNHAGGRDDAPATRLVRVRVARGYRGLENHGGAVAIHGGGGLEVVHHPHGQDKDAQHRDEVTAQERPDLVHAHRQCPIRSSRCPLPPGPLAASPPGYLPIPGCPCPAIPVPL